jgi:Coatomer WD associated region
MLRIGLIMLCAFLFTFSHPQTTPAQIDLLPDFEPITAQNVTRLQPVAMLGTDLINAVAWSPDGQTLLIAGSAGLWRYDMQQPSAPPTLIEGYGGLFRSVAFHPNEKLFVTGNDQGDIRFWNTQTWQEDNRLKVEGSAEQMTISPNGHLLAIGTDKSVLSVWDIATQELVQTVTLDQGQNIRDITFSHDGSLLALVTHHATHILRMATGEMTKIGGYSGGNGIAFSPDDRWLLSARQQNKGEGAGPVIPLEIWDVATATNVKSIIANDANFHALMFSSDDTILIADDSNILVMSFKDMLALPETERWYSEGLEPYGEPFAIGDALIQRQFSGGDLLALSPDMQTLASVTNTTIQLRNETQITPTFGTAR